jgi:hypothetical protein
LIEKGASTKEAATIVAYMDEADGKVDGTYNLFSDTSPRYVGAGKIPGPAGNHTEETEKERLLCARATHIYAYMMHDRAIPADECAFLTEDGYSTSISTRNAHAIHELAKAITAAASNINGTTTTITAKSDVLERTLLKMAGIEATPSYPVKTRCDTSGRKNDTMFIDMAGLSEADRAKLIAYLNTTFGAGTAKQVEPYTHQNVTYDTSIEIKISTVQTKIVPELDTFLDRFAFGNPALIKLYKEQSVRPTRE